MGEPGKNRNKKMYILFGIIVGIIITIAILSAYLASPSGKLYLENIKKQDQTCSKISLLTDNSSKIVACDYYYHNLGVIGAPALVREIKNMPCYTCINGIVTIINKEKLDINVQYSKGD